MLSTITVTTAADSQDLVDLDTARDEIPSDSVTDDQLLRWISVASLRIAEYCNRVFIAETVEQTWRLNLCDRPKALWLDRYPSVAIDSVTVDGSVLDASGYEVDDRTGGLYRLSGRTRVCWSGSEIVVAYTGGYADPTEVPAPLAEACLLLIRHTRSQRSRDPMLKSLEIPGVSTETFWVGQVSDDGLPPEASSLLGSYRRIVV